MNIIDGKAISAKCKNETAEEIKALTKDGRRAPCLAVILVGDDPASQVYVRNKKRACEAVGITSLEYLLDGNETEEKLLELINFHDVTIDWVKGHAGHPENERCDQLATAKAAEYSVK